MAAKIKKLKPARKDDTRFNASSGLVRAMSGRTNVKVYAFLLLTAFICLIFPAKEVYERFDIPKEGDIAKRTIIAPFTFDILKTEEELKRERAEAVSRVLPVMEYDYDVTEKMFNKFKEFFFRIDRLKNNAAPDSVKQGIWEELKRDISTATVRIFLVSRVNPENILYVVDNILDRGVSSVLVVTDPKQKDEFRARYSLDDVNALVHPGGFVTLLRDDRERTLPAESLLVKEASLDREKAAFRKAFPEHLLPAVYELIYAYLSPNIFHLEQETRGRREAAAAAVLTTRGKVVKDLEIVGKNKLVTPDIYRKLYSLKVAQEGMEQHRGISEFFPVAGRVVLIAAILLMFFLYVNFYRRRTFVRTSGVIAVSLIAALQFLLLVLAWHFIREFLAPLEWESGIEFGYLFPMVAGPMLMTILFDVELGYAFSVTACLLLGFVQGFDYKITLIHLLAAITACTGVRDIRNRSHFFIALLFYSLAYFLLIQVMELTRYGEYSLFTALKNSGLAVLSGLAAMMLTIPLMWLFEKVFSIMTNLTLIELSDMNSPALKKLSLEAPGTYHHSILVGNLAEAGAEAVDANPLKARVLAYYHDIGKVNKPEYFIENQLSAQDKLHEKVSPRMSALIISSHVKMGADMARKYKLPQAVSDVIREHHGTTLISFFYEKARELEPGALFIRDDFCYPGPKPSTKENAIIMLADSLEAASRTLDEPTASRLRGLVHSIFENKIADGQLDNCELTFIELARIKESFLPVLMSMFHTRIEYPGAARLPETA